MTPSEHQPEGNEGMEAGMRETRIRMIERALKFDPDHAYRRKLVSEFLDLTEPQKEAAE